MEASEMDKANKRLYWIWQDMKKRCYNPNCKCFKWYGGKGINVCEEWKDSYPNFKAWALSNGYEDGLTIDRIENYKDYAPFNCQWITQSENSKKRQREGKIILLEYGGESHGLREWSAITGINQTTLLSRIRSGWSVERTLTERVAK